MAASDTTDTSAHAESGQQMDCLSASQLSERLHEEINRAELADAASGASVPHLLKSARRAGLLEPEILEALDLSREPLIRGALRGSVESDARE